MEVSHLKNECNSIEIIVTLSPSYSITLFIFFRQCLCFEKSVSFVIFMILLNIIVEYIGLKGSKMHKKIEVSIILSLLSTTTLCGFLF